jgi:hypothetical protein
MSTQIPSQRKRSAAVGRNQRGEDKVGKTNLVFALRLILDPVCPNETDRSVWSISGTDWEIKNFGQRSRRPSSLPTFAMTPGCLRILPTASLIWDRRWCAAYQETTPITMGLAPTRIDALIRTLRLLIDSGTRGINEASLGTANPIF